MKTGRSVFALTFIMVVVQATTGCSSGAHRPPKALHSTAELNRMIQEIWVDPIKDPASVKEAARLNAMRGLCIAIVDATGAKEFAPTGGGTGGEVVMSPATVILRQG